MKRTTKNQTPTKPLPREDPAFVEQALSTLKIRRFLRELRLLHHPDTRSGWTRAIVIP
jgi:hypothetical protein